MRSIGIAATMLLVTLVVGGCKHRKEEPIPGPRAMQPTMNVPRPSHPTGGKSGLGIARPDGPRRHGASGISWFQGGFEEAFSRPKCTVMPWHEALGR